MGFFRCIGGDTGIYYSKFKYATLKFHILLMFWDKECHEYCMFGSWWYRNTTSSIWQFRDLSDAHHYCVHIMLLVFVSTYNGAAFTISSLWCVSILTVTDSPTAHSRLRVAAGIYHGRNWSTMRFLVCSKYFRVCLKLKLSRLRKEDLFLDI